MTNYILKDFTLIKKGGEKSPPSIYAKDWNISLNSARANNNGNLYLPIHKMIVPEKFSAIAGHLSQK